MDQLIIRVETYTVTQHWPDTLALETRPSGKFQCRIFRGAMVDNRMIASGPWRDSEAAAQADALHLRAGVFDGVDLRAQHRADAYDADQ